MIISEPPRAELTSEVTFPNVFYFNWSSVEENKTHRPQEYYIYLCLHEWFNPITELNNLQ